MRIAASAATGGTEEKLLGSAGLVATAISNAVKPRPNVPMMGPGSDEPCAQKAAPNRRTPRKLWEIPSNYHCSLLGIALGLDEMRKVASRIGITVHSAVEDYEIHHRMILVARQSSKNGRKLHRYLADKFTETTKAFKQINTDAELRAAWDVAHDTEDLASVYWALLTHPAVSEEVADEAFAHVHMFSHGAVGEIHKLQEQLTSLKREHELQSNEIQRERHNKERLRRRMEDAEASACDTVKLTHALSRAERDVERLKAELCQLKSVQKPAIPQDLEFNSMADKLERAVASSRSWRLRYRKLQRQLGSTAQHRPQKGVGSESRETPATDTPTNDLDLRGCVIAYVGGRSSVVPHLRAISERANARFVHHDGGVDERVSSLDEGIARSDLLVVPVTCVSHDAARRIKHECRRFGTRIVWLRRASISAFELALHDLALDLP